MLKKEIMFQHFEDRIIIRYTLVDAHSATTLRLKPYMAFRSVREFTHENGVARRDYREVQNGIAVCMYEGYPELVMQLNKANQFVYRPDWYRGLEYPKEQERGYAGSDALYVTGYFEFHIKKGESVVFSAGLTETKTSKLKETADFECGVRTPRDNFLHCLINSAHQFLVNRDGENYILAGYPWFKCRARDLFISLPGLTLANEEVDKFEAVMTTAAKGIRDFIAGKPLSVKIYEIEQPDVLLWAMWCIQQYGKLVSQEKCTKKYGTLVTEIMEFLLAGGHPNLQVHDNGLVYSNGRDRAVTWMNSQSNGRPVVPRSGYIVEFNALWYNALMHCAAAVAQQKGGDKKAAELEELAAKCKASFQDTFLNQYGYLLDYVDGQMQEWSVRPNQIFAVALDYSPLEPAQKKSVLDMCTKELLTPKGLRSLSPKSGGYNPMYTGPQQQRDLAYHQGTAWPWLAGFYFEACLRVYKNSRLSFIERQLVGYEEELFYHCIGTLPELFDGNPPFHGRGAISFAMNVAEILRVVKILEKYNLEMNREETV